MRSYYSHLETFYLKTVTQKPILRSSAIFPVFNQKDIHARLLFMGYWILKRNIREIATVVTLRDSKGQALLRNQFLVDAPKTYRIELNDLLAELGWDAQDPFKGSIEIEFFSTHDLVFPYPAVVVNYYGPSFSGVVHTAERVYNDFEDMHKNSETAVPESGFNIYADNNREPLIALVNGPEEMAAQEMTLDVFNHKGDVLQLSFPQKALAPYEVVWLYPARGTALEQFLEGKAGGAKLYFHLKWVFPRLLVGNLQKNPAGFVITHSYYDTNKATSDKDYWQPQEEGWHQASLMLPVDLREGQETSIYFYPIYSPSKFGINAEIYDCSGHMLSQSNRAVVLGDNNYKQLSVRDLTKSIPNDQPLAIRLIAYAIEHHRLPARIKVAYDLGNPQQALPCNICTNLQPFVPAWKTKESTFKWGPVLADNSRASVWIMNSSPHKHFGSSARIVLTFFRESDTQTLVREMTLPPHGFVVIAPDADAELKSFFQGIPGWFTAVSTNPYTTTYYFAEGPSGIVGGDHGF